MHRDDCQSQQDFATPVDAAGANTRALSLLRCDHQNAPATIAHRSVINGNMP
jgi:hypothetical protein